MSRTVRAGFGSLIPHLFTRVLRGSTCDQTLLRTRALRPDPLVTGTTRRVRSDWGRVIGRRYGANLIGTPAVREPTRHALSVQYDMRI